MHTLWWEYYTLDQQSIVCARCTKATNLCNTCLTVYTVQLRMTNRQYTIAQTTNHSQHQATPMDHYYRILFSCMTTADCSALQEEWKVVPATSCSSAFVLCHRWWVALVIVLVYTDTWEFGYQKVTLHTRVNAHKPILLQLLAGITYGHRAISFQGRLTAWHLLQFGGPNYGKSD
jgi:hypothetical protein